jgi:RHS repeat-associated protein
LPPCTCQQEADDDTANCTPSKEPIDYSNGQIVLRVTDLSWVGFGFAWNHARSYANLIEGDSDGTEQGKHWFTSSLPYLVFITQAGVGPTIGLVMGTYTSVWFAQDGEGGWVPRFYSLDQLSYDTVGMEYVVHRSDGSRLRFYGDGSAQRGALKAMENPFGATAVLNYNLDNEVSAIEWSDPAGGASSAALRYTYTAAGLFASVSLEVNEEAVRRVRYTYVDDAHPYALAGSTGDLLSAVLEQWEGMDWEVVREDAYRYYVEGESDGFEHGLKMVFGPQSVVALREAGLDPWSSSDAQLQFYADQKYVYNADRRVVSEAVRGGSSVYGYEWTDATPRPGYNQVHRWCRRCVEDTPDGNQTVVYTNRGGAELVRIVREVSSGNQWVNYNRVNQHYRVSLRAEPSAVASVSEPATPSDPLTVVLNEHAGLIHTNEYYAATDTSEGAAPGYLKARHVKQGSADDSPVLLNQVAYQLPWVGAVAIYYVWKNWDYPVAGVPQSQAALTVTERSYYFDESTFSNTYQVQTVTVTPPVISTAQHGTGLGEPADQYYDLQGRLVWERNARGFINHYEYDAATDARVRLIRDVDTLVVAGCPWNTPVGGGKNLVTDYLNDLQGRMLRTLQPWIEIDPATVGGCGEQPLQVRPVDYVCYRDPQHQVWTAQGYMAGEGSSSWEILGPVSLALMDAGGNVTDEIQAPACCGCGPLGPESFGRSGRLPAQCGWTRWTHQELDTWGRVLESRVYHTIPANGEGFATANYDATETAYDEMNRIIRTESPGGTIMRSVYDVRGLVTAKWVGTDDAGATESDPSGGGTAGNNMKPVWLGQYDGGAPGGDGNLTQATLPVDGSSGNDRVTTYAYDPRDRRTSASTQDNISTQTVSFTTDYDNLDRVTERARYFTDRFTALVRTHFGTSSFDNRGRAYEQKRYYVNTDGTLGDALVADTWYDPNNNMVKQTAQGMLAVVKTDFDSLDRPVTQYLVSEDASTSEDNTNSVALDVVIEQNETAYNDASEVVATTNRARFDDATLPGPLHGPNGSQPKSRDSFVAMYPDPIGRPCSTANYGTNSGVLWTRSEVHALPSDTVLVSGQLYARDGGIRAWIDPQGTVTMEERDAAGRRIRLVENAGPVAAADGRGKPCATPPCIECPDTTSRTSEFQYAPDGGLSRLILRNPATGEQVTNWSYGSTLADSAIASSLVPVRKTFPTGESETQTYNRQSEVAAFTDANGSMHAYIRDKMARLTNDSIPILGTGVDGTVRLVTTDYSMRGLPQYTRTYGDPEPIFDSQITQNRQDYNGLDCLTQDVQPIGPFDGGVHYTCTAGTDGLLRRVSVIAYEGIRNVTYEYGDVGSIDYVLNRVQSVHDYDLTVLAEFSYVGAAMPAVTILPQPTVQRRWKKLPGEPYGDGGDPYTGYDRFGRTQWMRWFKQDADDYASLVDEQWGYSRASLKNWRRDLQAPASANQDQKFGYDDLYQVSQRQRGLLNVNLSAVGGTPAQQENFTYDETGNWINYQQQNGGSLGIDENRTNNRSNQIVTVNGASADIAYNRNGNMVSVPASASSAGMALQLVWDAWNRLISASPSTGGSVLFTNTYDGRGRCCRSEDAAGHLQGYAYDDQWRCIEAYYQEDSESYPQVDMRYVWHPANRWELLLRDRSPTHNGDLSERFYSMKDQFDPVAICDATGTVKERYAYSAFGLVTFMDAAFTPLEGNTSAYAWNFLFHAEFADPQTGWYDYGYRDYVPQLGRWLSRDPIGEEWGWNLYQIASNDLPNLSDILGLKGGKLQFPPKPPPNPKIQPDNGPPNYLDGYYCQCTTTYAIKLKAAQCAICNTDGVIGVGTYANYAPNAGVKGWVMFQASEAAHADALKKIPLGCAVDKEFPSENVDCDCGVIA